MKPKLENVALRYFYLEPQVQMPVYGAVFENLFASNLSMKNILKHNCA